MQTVVYVERTMPYRVQPEYIAAKAKVQPRPVPWDGGQLENFSEKDIGSSDMWTSVPIFDTDE